MPLSTAYQNDDIETYHLLIHRTVIMMNDIFFHSDGAFFVISTVNFHISEVIFVLKITVSYNTQKSWLRMSNICVAFIIWWRHQMETFSALLAICAGNSPVPGEFPAQRPVTRSFDVFFDLRLNKRLSKQSRGWWFETLSRPSWRHRNKGHWLVELQMWPTLVTAR